MYAGKVDAVRLRNRVVLWVVASISVTLTVFSIVKHL